MICFPQFIRNLLIRLCSDLLILIPSVPQPIPPQTSELIEVLFHRNSNEEQF